MTSTERWGWRHHARRIFNWRLYVALLIASFIVQWLWPVSLDHRPTQPMERIALPVFTADAPLPSSPPTTNLAYQDYGQKGRPVVILLHGSPGVAANFDHLVPLLSPHFRLIIPDLPGFGQSGKWVPDYSIRAHARYVLALMDRLQIDRAQVLGFSMGSGVALNMADLAPDRLNSITLYGGIGIQEGEGSGSYALEHAKYGIGYALLVVGAELVPHFGLLGPRDLRHAFLRNFWDTDQRPLRGILERLRPPLLVLHGTHDPLVAAWVAEEHHRLVPTSEYVLFDSSHFMLFDEGLTRVLAGELLPFLQRHQVPAPPTPRTKRYPGVATPQKPQYIAQPLVAVAALAAATFGSEDLTCITAGELIGRGDLDWFVGVFGCLVGIFFGDLLLWAIGRTLGRRALKIGWIARRVPTARLDAAGQWLRQNTIKAVFTARFVPGLRLPTYLAAGVLGRGSLRFMLATLAAALCWTPLLVTSVAVLGDRLVAPLRKYLGGGLSLIAAVAIGWSALWLVTRLATASGRTDLRLNLIRLSRYEYWPMWAFYPPVIAWIAWLAIRHRGLRLVTAVNPSIPHSGLVGESKFDILRLSNHPVVSPTVRVSPADVPAALQTLRTAASQPGWGHEMPLILKPDIGQRGAGVRLARTWNDVQAYLAVAVCPVVAQPYHPGPLEAGVFYYRLPGQPTGHIFSITDKVFPVVTGDGVSSLEQLIRRHPRFRLQASTFLARHAARLAEVPPAGQTVRLAVAGNHCQGTLFRDGARLITPELTRAIDDIAQSFPGFHFGRFDIRYADEAAFKAGRDLCVVELNGITSESTNIYDPSWSVFRAYRTLFAQWSLLFKIGAANQAAGVPTSTYRQTLRDTLRYYRGAKAAALAD